MFAAHEHAHARASKKQLFRPRKSTLEAPKRRPGEPGTHQDRCAERPNHPDARRPTENLAKERTLERSNAVSSPWSRCKSARSPSSPKTGLVIFVKIYIYIRFGAIFRRFWPLRGCPGGVLEASRERFCHDFRVACSFVRARFCLLFRRLLVRSFACSRALVGAFVRLSSCVCACVLSFVRSYVVVYARRVHNVSSRSALVANTLMAICIRSVHTSST